METRPTAIPASPIHGRWRSVDPATGRVVEVDVIAASPADWARRPESRDPAWSARDFRGLVLALSVTF